MKQNATIKSIADRLGVSISTVSRALKGNKKIGLKTREAVNNLASQLNYVPNPVALNLQQCRTNTIGLLVPTLIEEFFGHVITTAEDIARKTGFKLLISQSQNSMEKEKEVIDYFIKNRVDGMLISLSSETNDYSHLSKLEKHGIPAVYFDRIPRNFPADVVKSEITDCTQQAISYLFEKNITKIALLNGPTNLLVADERLNGYLQGMQLHNLLTSPKYIKSTDLSEKDTIQKMEEFFNLKSDCPQAILCFNDYILLQATKACKKHGIVPHKDIHFVSFANTSFTQYLDPKPLISIEQFPAQMGLESTTILLNKIKDKSQRAYEEITIPTKLIFNSVENLNP